MSDLDDRQKLLDRHRRRLQKLKEKAAFLGVNTPAEIEIEIEDISVEIARLETELYPPDAADATRPSSPARDFAPDTPRIFICYKRHLAADQQLAVHLRQFFEQQGCPVFIDLQLQPGQNWLDEIDRRIKTSDFVIALLSKTSANSEMVQAEVKRAYEYRKRHGRPRILPVRVAYEGLLPYAIDALIDSLQYAIWRHPGDNQRVAQELLTAITGGQLPTQSPIAIKPVGEESLISEDGSLLPNEDSLEEPLPAFDPRFLDELEAPGGTVKLRDKFYIERDSDDFLKRELTRGGTLTTIRASRQKGKSSLLVRGVQHARRHGSQTITLDLQRVDSENLQSPADFLYYLAKFIIRKLRLDLSELDALWAGSEGPQEKFTRLFEDYILPENNTPLVLAIDEADSLLRTTFYEDFFALVRFWHNSAAYDEAWEKLSLVLVISTETHLFISDFTQSPFNAGLRLYLENFTPAQVRDLNWRHGSPVAEGDFAELMRLLNGHPYLTRKALYTLVVEKISWAELMKNAATENGPFDDHLRRQQWLLQNDPALKYTLIDIIRDQAAPDETAAFRLHRAGLILETEQGYRCSCDLYRTYFSNKL